MNIRYFFLTATMMLIASSGFAQSIVGSKHDLTETTNNVYTTAVDGRICVFCHVPHNANPAVNGVWNRGTPSVPFTWTNTSPTIGGTVLPAAADAQSVRCFTCHDGSTDIGALYNGASYSLTGADVDTTTGALTNSAYVIDNSSMDGNHPVSVSYPNPVNASDYNGTTTGAGVVTTTYNAAPSSVRIYADASGDRGIECGSCHDPHDTTNVFFLRDSLNGSALCLNCHLK